MKSHREALAHLQAHGVAVRDNPRNATPWEQIHLTDPDGNVIELNAERKERQCMSPDRLRVIARLKARPDKVGELRGVLRSLLAPTRREAGCIRYQMLENREDPTDSTFTEEWTDAAALATHFETQHIRSALARFPELLAEDLDLRRYRLVG